MSRRYASIAVFTIIASMATLFAQNINTLSAQEKAQGWQLLFDGKTLSGWHSAAPPQPAPGRGRAGAPPQGTPGQFGISKPCTNARASSAFVVPPGGSHWEVVNGSLTSCGDPAGYLVSDQSYKNFVLSVEFNTAAETNSGVYVRSPKETGGYEVQIWRQQPAGYNTGGIVGTGKTAREYTFKPDQWNRYEITADGDHLIVVLNGETTLDMHDAKFSEGHIRFQYQQFPIAFRNIKIRPLP
jgi:hypothetical protein